MKTETDIIQDEVFETTYQIVVGDMSVEMLVNRQPTVTLLYDPFELNKQDFIDLLDDLIEHYIDKEEYLKCAKLRDIKEARDSHDGILNEIVLDVLDDDIEYYAGPEPVDIKPNGLNKLIDTIKNMDPNTFTKGFREFIKKEPLDNITNAEMWSIMDKDDRDIFKGSFAEFYKWVISLPMSIRDQYIDRLLNNKTLIPSDDTIKQMREEYLEDDVDFVDEQEDIDYVNNVVISFLDKYTIMSHTDIEKLKEIRASLILHGILDVELRQKGDVYSLVYNSSQKPIKPNWN